MLSRCLRTSSIQKTTKIAQAAATINAIVRIVVLHRNRLAPASKSSFATSTSPRSRNRHDLHHRRTRAGLIRRPGSW
jgi:hypothetical protein